MDLDADLVDEDLLFEPAPAAVPAVRKFQPKGKAVKPVKAHPRTGKHVQAPSKAHVVAAQLDPPVTEAPVCISNTKASDEKPTLPIATIDKSLIDASGLDSSSGSASQLEVFSLEHRISDVNEDTALSDKGEAEMLDSHFPSTFMQRTEGLDTNSLVEDAIVPPARAVQALYKSPPKPHLKIVKPEEAPAPSNAPAVATQLISPITEPLVRISDPKSPGEKSSLAVTTTDDPLLNASDLDSAHGSVGQAEAFPSEPLVFGGNEDTSQCDRGEGEGAMDFGADYVDEDFLFQPAPAAVRAVPKFQPKKFSKTTKPVKAHPKTRKPVEICSKASVDASQLVPPVSDAPVCISDTMSTDEKPSLQIASIDESLVDSGLDSTHESSCQAEIFPSEPLISGGNMDTSWSDQGEREGAMGLDTDSAVDDFLLPPASSVRTLDTHPKFVKSVESPSKLPAMASQLVPPIMVPPGRISDLKSPDKKSSLPISSIDDSLINASDLDRANGSVCHPEASLSEPLISNVGEDTSQRDEKGEGAMDLDTNSPAKDFHPVASIDDSAINETFSSEPSEPVVCSGNHEDTSQFDQGKWEGAMDLNIAINETFSSEPVVCSGNYEDTSQLDQGKWEGTIDLNIAINETLSSEPVVCSSNYEDTSQLDQGKWEGAMDLNTDSLVEDCFHPSAPPGASNFRPKLITRPKERKVKKVSFNFSDTVEAVHTVDAHISFAQSDVGEKLTCNTTEVESSFVQMLCEGSLDETSDSAFTVSDCNEDAGMGQLDYEKEDISEILGLEPLEKDPSQSTSKIAAGKFQPKLSSKLKGVKPKAFSTTHSVIESEKDSLLLESESLEGHGPIVPPYSLFDSVTTCDSTPSDFTLEQPYHVDTYCHDVASQENNHLVVKDHTSHLSKDTSKEAQSHDSERAEPVLNENSTSKVVEDGASKATRKMRKRVNKTTPTDKIHENQEFDNSNIQEGEGIHSGDGCRGEEAPKQKRARRISKKPVTETEKPTRKRKKASEELGSTEQEPMKKKFPHATRRKRRQVNKELLLMPEEEIDRSQLSIKDLIRTYEAKERISKKEAAAGGNSSFNQRANPFGTNGEFWGQEDDFENYDVQLNVTTTKWNHHSFRKNPTSTSRWSKAETDLFYQALRQFGTNFEMIQKLFPGRTRHQMTLKFKNERRKYPLQIADATTHPSKDFSLVKLVMQALADEEKEKAKKKVYYVNNDEDEYEEENEQAGKEEQDVNDWEGGLDKEKQEANEWEGGLDKEEQEANEWEDGFESSAKPDNYEDVVESSNQFEYEENSQWDGNASHYQDTETDEFSFLL